MFHIAGCPGILCIYIQYGDVWDSKRGNKSKCRRRQVRTTIMLIKRKRYHLRIWTKVHSYKSLKVLVSLCLAMSTRKSGCDKNHNLTGSVKTVSDMFYVNKEVFYRKSLYKVSTLLLRILPSKKLGGREHMTPCTEK